WIDLFVDFLVTKHGLAGVLQSDQAGFDTLHAYFLDRLVPVCTQLLDAAAE
ncbi:TetR family transcriptional regulator, partial [Amycolatopsis magusensis]|nr:TetR family transcriptional regulator [Amycolatopsis magusensis]